MVMETADKLFIFALICKIKVMEKILSELEVRNIVYLVGFLVFRIVSTSLLLKCLLRLEGK